jgi:hypothetical protein
MNLSRFFQTFVVTFFFVCIEPVAVKIIEILPGMFVGKMQYFENFMIGWNHTRSIGRHTIGNGPVRIVNGLLCFLLAGKEKRGRRISAFFIYNYFLM